MEQRVAERTAELVASNERLQATIAESRRAEEALREAGRQKNEFLAMLAHELRTPWRPSAMRCWCDPGISDHDAPEQAITMGRNTHTCGDEPTIWCLAGSFLYCFPHTRG
ncbi:MAG: hypothetical protein ACREV4_01765 [Gammaproteobacteria bacterium]